MNRKYNLSSGSKVAILSKPVELEECTYNTKSKVVAEVKIAAYVLPIDFIVRYTTSTSTVEDIYKIEPIKKFSGEYEYVFIYGRNEYTPLASLTSVSLFLRSRASTLVEIKQARLDVSPQQIQHICN